MEKVKQKHEGGGEKKEGESADQLSPSAATGVFKNARNFLLL